MNEFIMLKNLNKCNCGTLMASIVIVIRKPIIMKTTRKNRKVTFDKMLSLLNTGMDKYMTELGTKSLKNPSFVFVERSSPEAA